MSKRLDLMHMNIRGYSIIVEPLSSEDGGGFVAAVTGLPDGLSDGEIPKEAIVNMKNAIEAWIEVAKELGHSVAQPARRFAMTA